jgi:hypothetical protein
MRVSAGIWRFRALRREATAASKNCSDLQSIEAGTGRHFFTTKLLILVSGAKFLVHNAVPTISFL